MSGITHTKVSSKTDGADATEVLPSDWNATHAVDYVAPTGLTGATAVSRYVGATASGAPVSGTFAVGDFVIDRSGSAWVCTVAGSPGTWVQMAGGSVPLAVSAAALVTAYFTFR
jgi:hypothetical protein